MKKLLFLALLGLVLASGCVENPEGNCCPKCTDPSAILIKAPGGECQCMSSCPSNAPHFLEEIVGSNCCTDKECSIPDSTTTTIASPSCAVVGNVCYGTCPDGQTCSDTGPAIQYPYEPTCGCLTSCSYIGDVKSCRNGGCPDGLICAATIQGLCSCQQAVY
jgi:hypothetical protein